MCVCVHTCISMCETEGRNERGEKKKEERGGEERRKQGGGGERDRFIGNKRKKANEERSWTKDTRKGSTIEPSSDRHTELRTSRGTACCPSYIHIEITQVKNLSQN